MADVTDRLCHATPANSETDLAIARLNSKMTVWSFRLPPRTRDLLA